MVYRFGSCELDAARFELRRAGQTVPVEPQVLELLLYLVTHRSRAVTRAELFEKLWHGRVVGDSALNSRIKAARAAIGDDGEAQEQIRTLHRTGYRFVGAVEELDLAVHAPNAPPPAVPLAQRRFGLAALGLALAVGVFSLLPREARDVGVSAAVASSVPAPSTAVPAGARKTLAVLPFANLSLDDEQEYFADGVGVELLKLLSHLPDLQVTGRSSSLYFEGRSDPPAAIGRQLGVTHLLTGSVQRAGERVRIAVELVDAASGYQVWTESYDRELGDIFDVQDEIAAHVATALQVKLGLGESGELGMTRSVEAYDAFLRGYAAYNEHTPDGFAQAVEHMHRAIALDANFSRAWAYLYCIYLDGGDLMPGGAAELTRKAQEALEHARKLTPDSPFVQVLNAREDMRFGRRLEARARLAALPAGYWTADRFVTRDVFLGRALISSGHAKEAVETLERARAADPLSPVIALFLSLAYAAAGDAGQSLAAIDRGIELKSLTPVLAGNALLVALGTRDAAEIVRRATAEERFQDPLSSVLITLLDDPAAARAELSRYAALPSPPNFPRRVTIAHWAAYFGDTEFALGELDALANGSLDEGLFWRPILSDVRKLPGFKALVRREGLVDYWQATGWPDLCRPTTADDFECS